MSVEKCVIGEDDEGWTVRFRGSGVRPAAGWSQSGRTPPGLRRRWAMPQGRPPIGIRVMVSVWR